MQLALLVSMTGEVRLTWTGDLSDVTTAAEKESCPDRDMGWTG